MGLGRGRAERRLPDRFAVLSSTFRDRAVEILSAFPSATRLAVDLEIYTGTLHHYDAGPCRCASCLSEFAAAGGTDLESFEEDRLVALLTSWLRELAACAPGSRSASISTSHRSCTAPRSARWSPRVCRPRTTASAATRAAARRCPKHARRSPRAGSSHRSSVASGSRTSHRWRSVRRSTGSSTPPRATSSSPATACGRTRRGSRAPT